MSFIQAGQMNTQAGIALAQLQAQALQQDRQMRAIALENFQNRMFQKYLLEEQQKQEEKARKRKLTATGVGLGVGAVGGLAAAPLFFGAPGISAAGSFVGPTLPGGLAFGATGPSAGQSALSSLLGSGFGASIGSNF